MGTQQLVLFPPCPRRHMNAGPPHPARYLVQAEPPTALTRSQCHPELIPLDLDGETNIVRQNNALFACKPGSSVARWVRRVAGRETWAPSTLLLSIWGNCRIYPTLSRCGLCGRFPLNPAREAFQNRGAEGAGTRQYCACISAQHLTLTTPLPLPPSGPRQCP